MRITTIFGTSLVAVAAAVALASPAMAKGGGGGGGGGGTTVPGISCAQITSAVVNPNPVSFDPKVFPMSGSVGPAAALDVTVNNQCIDEGGGPRASAAVALTTFDTATGAQLFTGVNMQPAGMLMTWRYWLSIPTPDATAPAYTEVLSVTKSNGQIQDTRTFTAAALDQAILTAEATQTPQSIG